MEFGHFCGEENLQRNINQTRSKVIRKSPVATIGNTEENQILCSRTSKVMFCG